MELARRNRARHAGRGCEDGAGIGSACEANATGMILSVGLLDTTFSVRTGVREMGAGAGSVCAWLALGSGVGRGGRAGMDGFSGLNLGIMCLGLETNMSKDVV